jgi:hypothetical protein
MAAGEADTRADAVEVEKRSAKGLSISMPPDLTMMVELALIKRPPPRSAK